MRINHHARPATMPPTSALRPTPALRPVAPGTVARALALRRGATVAGFGPVVAYRAEASAQLELFARRFRAQVAALARALVALLAPNSSR